MTEQGSQPSTDDLVSMQVQGEEIIEQLNAKLQMKVELIKAQQAYHQLNEEYQENIQALEKAKAVIRERDQRIQDGTQINARQAETINELRRRVAELSRPTPDASELVGEQGARGAHVADTEGEVDFIDPEDGPLIDSV